MTGEIKGVAVLCLYCPHTFGDPDTHPTGFAEWHRMVKRHLSLYHGVPANDAISDHVRKHYVALPTISKSGDRPKETVRGS